MSATEKAKESFNTLSHSNNYEISDRRSVTTQELQDNLERRLELLGPSTDHSGSSSTSNMNPLALETRKKSDDTSIKTSGEHENNAVPSSPSQRPVVVMNKNILLARIMAAQEKAKEAQQPKRDSSIPIQSKINDTTISQNDSSSRLLNPNLDVTQENILESKESRSYTNIDTPVQDNIHLVNDDHGEDYANQHSYESSFYVPLVDTEKSVQISAPQDFVPNPSAPPLISMDGEENNQFVSQSIPPSQSSLVPLSFTHACSEQPQLFDPSQNLDIDLSEFDAAGHLLSAEEKQKLIEEQRLIYDRIRQENQLNDAAIAAAQADTFDERVNVSLAGSMAITSHSHPETSTILENNELQHVDARRTSTASDDKTPVLVDIGGGKQVSLYGTERTLDAIKEGTAILVQCVSCEEWMQLTNSATLMYCPKCKVISEVVRQSAVKTKEEAIRLTLDRKMARDMQERENQLMRSATVSPGTRTMDHPSAADETTLSSYLPSFITKVFYPEGNDMSRSLTMAHEASPVSEEVNRRNSSEQSTSSWFLYPGVTEQSNPSSDSVTSAVESRYLEDMSIWNYFSSMLSLGGSQQNSSIRRSAEIGVSRPPSSFLPPQSGHSQMQNGSPIHERSHVDAPDMNDEYERLIQRTEPASSTENANIWGTASTRVGDHQPMLSCVVDSISHTAIALGSVLTSRSTDVGGIDRTSLLVQGRSPRQITDDDSSETDGSYHQITNH